MTWFVAAIATFMGTSIGSFVNVVVHRVPRSQSVVRPASRCPSCLTPLRAIDNIPVVSFLLLRGKCRACTEQISLRYPLLELATGGLWLGSVLRFGATEHAAFAAVMGTVFLALAQIDIEHRRLPNGIVMPAIALAATWVVIAALVRSSPREAVTAIASGAALFALMLTVALASGAMGMGDVKLAAFVGIVSGRFGAGVALAALLSAFVLGGLAAAALLASRKRGRKDGLPFGPALGAGTMTAVFVGRHSINVLLGV